MSKSPDKTHRDSKGRRPAKILFKPGPDMDDQTLRELMKAIMATGDKEVQ